MNDQVVEERRGGRLLSTDRARIDRDAVLSLLHGAHWGGGMTRPQLDRAIENSVCFGVFESDRQLGFARAVTDLSTYAYLTDVIVEPDARGQGLGAWMIAAIIAHPDLQGLRRIALWSRDAAPLYARFGFTTEMPRSTYMERRLPR